MRFLLDVNVLLALSLPRHQHHAGATRWFDSGVAWATTPLTEAAYVRLSANPAVVGYDVTPAAALDALRRMQGVDGWEFLADTTSLADPVIDVARLAETRLVTDFHLVNLAASAGLTLATYDGSLFRALPSADQGHVLVLDD